jgi:hypothetical protein
MIAMFAARSRAIVTPYPRMAEQYARAVKY